LIVAAERVDGAARTDLNRYVNSHQHAVALGAIVLQSKVDMERSIRAVADLVSGIIALFESGAKTTVSAMVLARSAGEMVMRFCHIHDPSVPPERTILRMGAYQLESVEDQLRTAEAFGVHGQDDVRQAREHMSGMHAFIADSGIVRLADARRGEFTVNLSLDKVTENIRFNATAAYSRYLQVGSWDWALGSGATHGRGWFLPNVIGTFHEAPSMPHSEVAVTVTLQILELATAFAVVIGGHTGVDTDKYLRKIHQRRIGATAAGRDQPGFAVGHQEYGDHWMAPTFPMGTGGAGFAPS
jgi:hypothetical protein